MPQHTMPVVMFVALALLAWSAMASLRIGYDRPAPQPPVVMGAYDAFHAYDASDHYRDLGDGRVSGTVYGVDGLDPDTLTVCSVRVIYRGRFGGDPFLERGWVRNDIRCEGVDDGRHARLYVHESDDRFSGEREPVWGDWEILEEAPGAPGAIIHPRQHRS